MNDYFSYLEKQYYKFEDNVPMIDYLYFIFKMLNVRLIDYRVNSSTRKNINDLIISIDILITSLQYKNMNLFFDTLSSPYIRAPFVKSCFITMIGKNKEQTDRLHFIIDDCWTKFLEKAKINLEISITN